MKFKGSCVALFVILFVLGFTSIASDSQIHLSFMSHLKMTSSNTNLKIGDLGFIRIQGKPKTKYNIRTFYQRGNSTVNVIQMRVTDDHGQTTFNWVVENGTIPQTNTAIITGGGESITTTHTVIQ